MPPPRKIIVTGASSQIGRFLLPRLVAAGYSVTAISRNPSAESRVEAVSWIAGDISDIGESRTFAFPRADTLIHVAPLRLLPALLHGFLAQGGKRIVCFGTTSRFVKAASADPGEQAFAAAQIAAEEAIATICGKVGAHWTLFRPTLIYGCEMDRNVTLIARLIRRFGVFPLFGAANGLRQPVHADDLAAACVAVLNTQAAFDKAYDLTGGETLRYRQMVERIFAALGRPARFIPVPIAAFRLAMWLVSRIPRFRDFNAEMARRMNDDLVFDPAPAQRDFGYAPRIFAPRFASMSNDGRRG
jgi:nucleoside-diphosphate-sugar epimerase